MSDEKLKGKEGQPTPNPEEGTEVHLARQSNDGAPTDNYVWIEATGESKHMPKGEKYKVHELSAQKLIDKGVAKACKAPEKKKEAAKK